MKSKLHFLSLILSVALTMSMTSESILYRDLTFNEALNVASGEDKLIFVNYFSVDVMECHEMTLTTFSNQGVVSFMNEHFVNINADIDEITGRKWIEKYNVECLPSFLVINKQGRLEGINQGVLSTHEFMQWISNLVSVSKKINASYAITSNDEITPGTAQNLIEIQKNYNNQVESNEHKIAHAPHIHNASTNSSSNNEMNVATQMDYSSRQEEQDFDVQNNRSNGEEIIIEIIETEIQDVQEDSFEEEEFEHNDLTDVTTATTPSKNISTTSESRKDLIKMESINEASKTKNSEQSTKQEAVIENNHNSSISVIDESSSIAVPKDLSGKEIIPSIKENEVMVNTASFNPTDSEIVKLEKVKLPDEHLENTSPTRTMSFSVQIGAFDNYINAEKKMKECKEVFEDHFYIIEEQNGTDGPYFYKVIVGTYSSRKEANKVKKTLEQKGHSGYLRRL